MIKIVSVSDVINGRYRGFCKTPEASFNLNNYAVS